jgi:hypothetical protein
LLRIAEGAFHREDYCDACWNQERTQGAYSTWNHSFYDPKVAELESEETYSPLRQLFYEAIQSEERVVQARAYLAAQLLRRQKVFRLVKEGDAAEEETRILLFTDRIGNRLIEVRDPNFSFRELEAGRVTLIERLQQLEAPEPAEDNGHVQEV